MGADKALLTLNGSTLLERALRTLAALGLEPKIVGSRPDLARFAPVVEDLRSGCGPLSGIEAGLLASEAELGIFTPVDVPLLPVSLLRRLLQRADQTGALATIPRLGGQVQPLCAVYRRALLPSISAALASGDYKVMRVIQGATGHAGALDIFDIETAMVADGDFAGWPRVPSRALQNCNTPADLQRIGQQVSGI